MSRKIVKIKKLVSIGTLEPLKMQLGILKEWWGDKGFKVELLVKSDGPVSKWNWADNYVFEYEADGAFIQEYLGTVPQHKRLLKNMVRRWEKENQI